MEVDLPRVTLLNADAIVLGHALVADLARRANLRVLAIKGPTFAAVGVPAERVSGDVDVLAHPDDHDALCAALEQHGWAAGAASPLNSALGHSTGLTHDGWPIEIDVHFRFPGFLEDAGLAFEALWEHRESRLLAEVMCEMPDRIGSLLIMGVNALRSKSTSERYVREHEEFVALLDGMLDEQERSELARRALLTGSALPLGEDLSRTGFEVRAEASGHHASAWREWRIRQAGNSTTTARVVAALFTRRASRDMVRQALWPREADLRADYPDLPAGSVAVTKARLSRVWRGVESLAITALGSVKRATRRETR